MHVMYQSGPTENAEPETGPVRAQAGTIALASSLRVLFMDGRAKEMLRLLKGVRNDEGGMVPVPALPEPIREVAGTLLDRLTSTGSAAERTLHLRRIVGSPLGGIRVDALGVVPVRCRDQDAMRIVMFLSGASSPAIDP